MKSILVLDDDTAQLNYMSKLLSNDFNISTASNSLEALSLINEFTFDALIVDFHMPIINGLEFIKKIKERANFNSSLFILSSDSSTDTKLKALNLGIKDFLWPLMQKDEMVLRIKNHLSESSEMTKKILLNTEYMDIEIDLHNMHACHNGKKLDLTLIEFKLLSYLINHANTLVERNSLKKYTWPDCTVLDKTINTHLTNLRNKISQSQVEIKSVKGEGIILT